MLSNMSEQSIKVLLLANMYAIKCGHDEVDSRHLLLAMASIPCMMTNLLKAESLDVAIAEASAYSHRAATLYPLPVGVEPSLHAAPELRLVLKNAAKISEQRSNPRVSTVDIFLAIVLNPECKATRATARLYKEISSVTEKLVNVRDKDEDQELDGPKTT